MGLAMAHVKYFWDEIEDNVIREYDENNNTIAHYTTEPELYGRVISQDRGGEVRHYKYDGQGNTVALTDNSGNVTDTRKHSAFGEVTESTGTTAFPYQFGGRYGYESDDNSRFSIRHRIYLAGSGRWLSKDPSMARSIIAVGNIELLAVEYNEIGGDTPFDRNTDTSLIEPEWHLPDYAFVNQSPTQMVDPSGLLPCLPHMWRKCAATCQGITPPPNRTPYVAKACTYMEVSRVCR